MSLVIYYFFLFLFFKINYFNWRLISPQYHGGFHHTLTWVIHGCPGGPHPEPHPPSPHPTPWGCRRALALSDLIPTRNLHWSAAFHMAIYTLQCCSLTLSSWRLLCSSVLRGKQEVWDGRVHTATYIQGIQSTANS